MDDAKAYSSHSGKKDIDTDDVQLAIQSRLDHSYTSPPPRDVSIVSWFNLTNTTTYVRLIDSLIDSVSSQWVLCEFFYL